MNRSNYRQLGILFIVLGILLIVYSLTLMNTIVNCPANGCPASYVQQLELESLIPFLSGIALVIIGVVIVVKSRSTDHKN